MPDADAARQYMDALAALAKMQARSDNPITRQWAVAHSAQIEWVEHLERRLSSIESRAAHLPSEVAHQPSITPEDAPIEVERVQDDTVAGADDAPTLPPPPPPPPPPPVSQDGPTIEKWDFSNAPAVPIRHLTVTPIVHEVTDTHVVVRVYITAPGWQRVRVFLEPGAEYDIDMSGRADPLASGEYRYSRPAVSREQEIVVIGMSEGSNSARVSTRIWLPQREDSGSYPDVGDSVNVEAVEPPDES